MDATMLCRVTNKGDRPIREGYLNQRWVINPGEEGLVPFGAVCLWFGDPGTVNVDELNSPRRDEIDRLLTKYGVYTSVHDPRWAETIPKVEVVSMLGDRITTVIEDPDGVSVSQANVSVSDHDSVLARLAELQREIDVLKQRKQSMDTPTVQPDAVEEDTPTYSKRGRVG